MLNQFLAIALVIIGMLPGFSGKVELENKMQNHIVSGEKPKTFNATQYEPIPYKVDPMADAKVTAKAAYFVDLNSGEVLYQKNASTTVPMASTTKLMTALIVVEKLNLDKTYTVGQLHTLPLDSIMGLKAGDTLTGRDLLHGLLIESGADTAETLAIATEGSQEHFVALMNEKASWVGLKNTQFTNPVGRDENGHYSTAEDMAKLARIALTNKDISEIVAKKTYVATNEEGKKFYLSNTNQLLGNSNYRGVKTGTTYGAGECLVSLYNDGERNILGVVLVSNNRYADTTGVIEWTKQAFQW